MADWTYCRARPRPSRARRRGGSGGRQAQEDLPQRPPTEGEFDVAYPVREPPIVADPREAAGQHVEELCGEAHYVARET
jgi:hypothetical protein